MKSLAGKVALVTGGTRNVGRGIALGLGEAGATVYVTGRSISEKDVRGITEAGGRAVACLASDNNLLARTGGVFSAAQLALDYGFVDIDGTQPQAYDKM